MNVYRLGTGYSDSQLYNYKCITHIVVSTKSRYSTKSNTNKKLNSVNIPMKHCKWLTQRRTSDVVYVRHSYEPVTSLTCRSRPGWPAGSAWCWQCSASVWFVPMTSTYVQISAWMACGKCLVLMITRNSLLVLLAQNGVMISISDSQLSTLWSSRWWLGRELAQRRPGSNPSWGTFLELLDTMVEMDRSIIFALKLLWLVCHVGASDDSNYDMHAKVHAFYSTYKQKLFRKKNIMKCLTSPTLSYQPENAFVEVINLSPTSNTPTTEAKERK